MWKPAPPRERSSADSERVMFGFHCRKLKRVPCIGSDAALIYQRRSMESTKYPLIVEILHDFLTKFR